MLTLRPTKMLARRLRLALPAAPPVVANRIADWCVHEFRAGRFKYLIFCNTASMFPAVTYARGVRNDRELIRCLSAVLQQTFVGTELESRYLRWIAPEFTAVQWAPIPDRSVIGSINDLVNMARYRLENRDGDPAELSAWLAVTPMSILGMNSPERAFPALKGPDAI